MTNETVKTNDTKVEEHYTIESAWKAIGPQGMAAAAVAAVAIGSANGWINAMWTIVAALSGAAIWLILMKLLMNGRPEGY